MLSCNSGLCPQHLARAFEEVDSPAASNAYVATSESAFLTVWLATEVSCLDVANGEEWFEVSSDVAGDDDDEADGYESDPTYQHAPSSYFASSSGASSDGGGFGHREASYAAIRCNQGSLRQQFDP